MKRNASVDLFRLIAAFSVVVLHILGQGGILYGASSGSINYWIAWLLEISAFCAVDCFALISGYVMVDKKIKLKNLINLWMQVFVYSIIITGIVFIFVPESRNGTNLLAAFAPIICRQWWYVSSYFGLFILMPFLNAGIDRLSKKSYEIILAAILIIVCVLDCIIPIDPFNLNSGYSAIWLIMVYLFGAYIKKHDVASKITAHKSLLLYFLMIAITFASKLLIYYIKSDFPATTAFEDTLISYTSITVFLSAIFLFLFCLRLKIRSKIGSVVSYIAPIALGVYLIHVQPLVFKYVIKNAFSIYANEHTALMVIHVLLTSLLIFLVCGLIEWLRIQLFKLLKVDRLAEFLESTFYGLFKRKD